MTNKAVTTTVIAIILLGVVTILFIIHQRPENRLVKEYRFPLSTSTKQPAMNRSKWQRNKLVVIPAIWKEINWTNPSSWPIWIRKGLKPSSKYRIHLYQRISANSTPPYNWPYAANVREEAGIYLKFIYDYYHDLPDKMLFIHGNPHGHIAHPIEAAFCVRDDVHYANINALSFKDRRWSVWPRDKIDNIGLMYKCAEYILGLFGFDAEAQLNPENITPKDDNVVSAKCCAQFYVTKERIRHYTYKQWSAAYQASLAGYCGSENAAEFPGEADIKWFGGSFEHLWHVILGLHPTNMHIPFPKTHSDECHLFRAGCPGSLCTEQS